MGLHDTRDVESRFAGYVEELVSSLDMRIGPFHCTTIAWGLSCPVSARA
jgi:hypothetical protein